MTSSELVEREAHLELLGGLTSAASSGAGGVLVLEGWPGVGKSALLDLAAAGAEGAGMRVLRARGLELGQDLPFGVAMHLFEPVAKRAGAQGEWPFVGAAAAAWNLFDWSGGNKPWEQDETTALAYGIYWLSLNLAEDQPLALIVDDVHWADTPSLRFFLYLAHRLPELPVALVIAQRRGERSPQRAAIDQLAALAGGRRIAVEPISSAACEELVLRYLPDAEQGFTAACAHLSGGNPLFLHALLSELMEAGVEPLDAHSEQALAFVPESISRMLLLRLEGLPPAARELAQALAVIGGDRGGVGHAAAIAEVGDSRLQEALDALVDASILIGDDPPRFIHPLIGSSIHSELAMGERSRLHAAAAAVLAAEGAGPEQLSAHLLQTLPGAVPETVSTLHSAAVLASSAGAPESARRYLLRALAEPPEAEERFVLLRELGEAEAAAGLPGATERIIEALHGMHRSHDRAVTMLALGRRHYVEGKPIEAAEVYERALEELGTDEDLPLRRQIQSEYFAAATFDPDRAPRAAEQALRLVGEVEANLESTAGSRALLTAVGLHLCLAGSDRELAISYAERAYDAGALLEEEGVGSDTLNKCTGILYIADELERDAEIATAAIADARKRGDLLAFATASYVRSGPLMMMGKASEAIADAEAAIAAKAYGWGQFLPTAYSILVDALLAAGRAEEAAARFEELDPERWSETGIWPLALGAKGRIQAAEGDLAAALETQLEAGETMPWPNPAMLGRWRADAAMAAGGLSRHEQALQLAEEELELTRAWGPPRAIGISLRALGVARAAAGADDGVETLRQAVEVLERSPAALERWYAELDLGRALRLERRGREAREALRRVAGEATRLGASGVAAAASEELALGGARPRREALSGVGSLTPGELRVARMAAGGMTNRQIGESLFVTIRAVQWHLGNTYRKLDIKGREELPGVLRDTEGAAEASEGGSR